MNNTINILWLYPDLLNLHGDRGNIMAFQRIGQMLGVKVNVYKVQNLTEKINLNNIDIVFINPGELGTILNIIKTLKQYRDDFLKFIQEEKYIITVGTSGVILSKEITTLDGNQYNGFGFIDMNCIERDTVIGDDIYYIINEEQEIIGSQIQMLDFEVLDMDVLGEVKYGYGNIKNGFEGARNKNAIFTNALGPVFVKNPWWAESILLDVAKRKEIKTEVIPLENYEFEIKSFNSTKKFIESKKNK